MKKSPISQLSDQYRAALRTYFEQGPEARLQAAQDLGRAAVDIGLETLALAKIHDRALATLLLPDCSSETRGDLTKRAASFFIEAIIPIEETHCRALEASADWNQLNATLKQRTQDLADANRELQQQITGRETSEDAFKNRRLASSRLLKDSLALEVHLRQMTRKILSTTEDERKKMCLQLSDEIVQTLVGIKLRMLALKNEIAAHEENCTKEIAIIQRLIEDSTKIVNQFAHEFST